MTPQHALAEGRLADALDLQIAIAAERPDDPAVRLHLFELQLLANRFRDAWATLAAIPSVDPAWPRLRRWYRRLVRAANDRHRGVPAVLPDDAPRHALLRRRALRSLRTGHPAEAIEGIDRADQRSPHLLGHVDGREFEGLRDADDRFASVLELFVGHRYVWWPFEHLRRIALAPPAGLLESAYRPARVRLADGQEFAAVLPLVYPGSVEDEHRLALETDHVNPDGGPVRCIGAKLLLLGEEELPLGEIRQLDVKAWA